MMRARSLLLASLLLLACGPAAQKDPEGPFALPFVENDAAAALGHAREAGLPVFVEVWAPW